jgi:hypothetical protein
MGQSLCGRLVAIFSLAVLLSACVTPGLPVPGGQAVKRPARSWPGPLNTGVPAGAALAPSGPLTVTTPGAVISGLDVDGGIDVQASHVTIKRTRVRGAGLWLIRVGDGVTGTRIEDTEVDGLDSTADSVAIGWHGFTAIRLNVHGTEDGFRLEDDVTVRDSWIHDLYACSSCHNDGLQSTGGSNITIKHNTISWPHESNSCVFLKSDLGTIDHVLVEDNLLDGGGYTVYSVHGDRYGAPTDVVFRNNRFGRDFVYGVKALDGSPAWVANVWDDTGAAVR